VDSIFDRGRHSQSILYLRKYKTLFTLACTGIVLFVNLMSRDPYLLFTLHGSPEIALATMLNTIYDTGIDLNTSATTDGTHALSGVRCINYVAERGAIPVICSAKPQLSEMRNQYGNTALLCLKADDSNVTS